MSLGCTWAVAPPPGRRSAKGIPEETLERTQEGGVVHLQFDPKAGTLHFLPVSSDGDVNGGGGSGGGEVQMHAGHQLFVSRIIRGRVRVFARTDGLASDLQNVTVQSLDDGFVADALRKGAHKLHAPNLDSMGTGTDTDNNAAVCGASKVACQPGSVCCGQTCSEVSGKETGGYCMCFPVGFYVGDDHLHPNGICQRLPRRDGLTGLPGGGLPMPSSANTGAGAGAGTHDEF
jgi:hypothetical protein